MSVNKLHRRWKRITPIPLEINYGYLWECPYCGYCIASFQGYPRLNKCKACHKEVADMRGSDK